MSKIRTNTISTIECSELDRIVRKTYGRPYCFQQQEGCQGRGTHSVYVPTDGQDFPNDTIPEIVNGEEMGVSFKAWLERDPGQSLAGNQASWAKGLWWSRNFYPSLDMVLDDLHKKGLIDAGEYTIEIDW